MSKLWFFIPAFINGVAGVLMSFVDQYDAAIYHILIVLLIAYIYVNRGEFNE
jgi:hypothetical protein